MDIDECVKEGFLKAVAPNKSVQNKELSSAGYDLKRSEASLEAGDCKWSIIQSYYAIFHSARALLNKSGYRERRHLAIGIVLEELERSKKTSTRLVTDFHAAMSAREDADYRDVYSKETAGYIFEVAGEFVREIRKIMADYESKKSKSKKSEEENENNA